MEAGRSREHRAHQQTQNRKRFKVVSRSWGLALAIRRILSSDKRGEHPSKLSRSRRATPNTSAESEEDSASVGVSQLGPGVVSGAGAEGSHRSRRGLGQARERIFTPQYMTVAQQRRCRLSSTACTMQQRANEILFKTV